jgi:hypothetical protein
MKQYMLSIYQPDSDPPPPDVLEAVMGAVGAVEDEMRAAGVWVFAAGLGRPSSAKVVDPRSERMPMIDGPYTEGKEHIGGLVVIKVDKLDDAVAWGRKVARATTLPVEVRRIEGELED